MIITKLLPEDTVSQMANKIFNDFQINQSCAIIGFFEEDGEIKCKGEEVWNKLIDLDYTHNWTDNRKRRKARRIKGSIGGMIPHKAFKHQKVVVDDKIKWTIWRVQ